jgi:hypothetical protein
MPEFFSLGPVPSDEPCAQVGEPDYEARAAGECRRYIELLRAAFGPEPEGARLAVRWSLHDFGRYAEVVCEFDPDVFEAVRYAHQCDAEAPKTWGGERQERPAPRFTLGRTVATQGAVRAMDEAGQEPAAFLSRHETGDWGDLEDEVDIQANEQALVHGDRILSVYHTSCEVRLYVITEWDRSVTTILLPEEY